MLDLVTVALAGGLDRTISCRHRPRQRALLVRIQAFIEQRLGDPGLTPDTIAAALISPRYLYSLFESELASVAGWIRQRRLEHCRRELLDPLLHKYRQM